MSAEDMDLPSLEGGLYADRGGSLIACAIVFAILCTLFVALRFISHRIGRRPISLEDWLIIPSWILMMGFCANVICIVKYGDMGRHQAWVLKFEPETMELYMKMLFVTEFLYGLILPLEKTSILLLYLRIFHVRRWFRFTTYVLLAFIWMWGISESLVAIFQCNPVAYHWDKSINGTCINQQSYYIWVCVPNNIHDVVMLILPMPVVWKLQIGLRKKLALSCVFVIGSFGCVASFIRLAVFFEPRIVTDHTWSIDLQKWVLAELGIILICACLPVLWPLITHFTSKIGSQHRRTNDGIDPSENSKSMAHGGVRVWNGNPQGFRSIGDDLIPLNDLEDAGGATHSVGSSLAHSEMGNHDSRIHVTKEFSWEATGSSLNKNTS